MQDIEISGATRLLPIIGRPTGQVKAPHYFNAFFRAKGIDCVTTAFSLEDRAADAFIDAIRGTANAVGFIATIPHKRRAAAACDAISDRGAFLGAVNLVRRDPDGRLVGEMTDGLGCVAAMRAHGVDPNGKRAFVVGVGGAGSAIGHALAEAGVARLAFSDLDMGRAEALTRRLTDQFPGVDIVVENPNARAADICVNASPAGMNDDRSMPASLDGVAPGTLVADVVTKPEETPWLKAARAAGCIAQTGAEMVQGQFELMANHFGFALD